MAVALLALFFGFALGYSVARRYPANQEAGRKAPEPSATKEPEVPAIQDDRAFYNASNESGRLPQDG